MCASAIYNTEWGGAMAVSWRCADWGSGGAMTGAVAVPGLEQRRCAAVLRLCVCILPVLKKILLFSTSLEFCQDLLSVFQ